MSGQHVAVETLLRSLESDGRFDVEHLRYAFAHTMEDQGSLSIRKAWELVRILGRMVRLRARGPIDVLVHPVGGTSTGSTIRDVTVVTASSVCARRTLLQFHGAGHGRIWADDRRLFVRGARRLLGRADGAVVHAQTHVADAALLGIDEIFVIPHRIVDTFDRELLDRTGDEVRVLYLGHLGPHRGTPQLLEAFARVANDDERAVLQIAGNPVGVYSEEALRADAARFGIQDRVEILGTVRGRAKDMLFARAHVFAFPSVFEAESFGLVLAEALMWGLPVVATDWQANPEVLEGAQAIVHSHAPDLSDQIASALNEAIRRVRSGEWPAFSARNRALFERRYRLDGVGSPIVDAVASMARPPVS